MKKTTMIRGRRVLAGAALFALCAAASAAEITFYQDANFSGRQLTLRGWTPDIAQTGFNDKASSIVVTSGRWEVCTDAAFKGYCATFVQGDYPVIDPRLNDRISSAREVGSYGERRGSYYDYGHGAIQLFAERAFAGPSVQLAGDAPTLRQNGFNDRAASVIVTEGTWELCADSAFTGACRIYAPGRYPDLGYGMAGQVSSARLVRPASDAPVVISSGYAASPPDATGRAVLYNERGLRGASLDVSGPVADLDRSSFNDATASIYVVSGSWLACRDSYFRGDCRIFGPGRYDDLSTIGFDRVISSIRPSGERLAVAPPAPPVGAALELFSEPGFGGQRLAIENGARDLEGAGFKDRAASVVVHAGWWELCTDVQSGGSCAVYRPGDYPQMGGLTRHVSSVRRIQ
jgi:hypothetical protein